MNELYSEEIHILRANLKEARQEHQALEVQVRELRSTDTATKVRYLTEIVCLASTILSSKLNHSLNNSNYLKPKLNERTQS